MPLRGAAKAAYQRSYMRARRAADRTFGWEAELAAERRRMKKAVKRVATAERWKSENPEAAINPNLLSLAWHWNQLQVEDEEKKKAEEKQKKQKRVRVRNATPLASHTVPAPRRFESLP